MKIIIWQHSFLENSCIWKHYLISFLNVYYRMIMKPLPTLIFSYVLLLDWNQRVLQAQQTNGEQPRQRRRRHGFCSSFYDLPGMQPLVKSHFSHVPQFLHLWNGHNDTALAKAFCGLMWKMLHGNSVTIVGGYLSLSENLFKFLFKFLVFS